jgi:hypothetical protein
MILVGRRLPSRGPDIEEGKRWWVRLHEKGGKRHEMPAHHTLEAYLDTCIEAARHPRWRQSPPSSARPPAAPAH